MHRLNLHYLRCFWAVAREGGLSGASGSLQLSQSTLSAQVRALERDLGLKLFVRVGRRLQLTDAGHMVLRYAEDMFALADELVGAAKGRETKGGTSHLRIGVSQAMTRLVAYQYLEPAYRLGTQVQLQCSEDRASRLLERLSAGELDVVLVDEPVPQDTARLHNHPLGHSTISFFGAVALARECRREFPKSLNGCPMLLPAPGMPLRRTLDAWFERQRIRPKIMGEFDDSALMKVFGQRGVGLFPAPAMVSDAILRQYDVDVAAEVPTLKEHYLAITPEAKIRHPLVAAICRAARGGR